MLSIERVALVPLGRRAHVSQLESEALEFRLAVIAQNAALRETKHNFAAGGARKFDSVDAQADRAVVLLYLLETGDAAQVLELSANVHFRTPAVFQSGLQI